MLDLSKWQMKHNVSGPAMTDLIVLLCSPADINYRNDTAENMSETAAQQRVRLEAPRHGERLYRNNVGAGYNERGNFFRWGIGNDSAAINKKIKFPDLIGICPVLITPEMVGHRVGIFRGVEMKKPGWVYKATEREKAQLAAHQLIISLGGLACFATGPGDVWKNSIK